MKYGGWKKLGSEVKVGRKCVGMERKWRQDGTKNYRDETKKVSREGGGGKISGWEKRYGDRTKMVSG
jgi:hypothetical protein